MVTRHVVGIDIGGTKTMVGLFDDRLDRLGEVKFRTSGDEDKFLAELTESITKVIDHGGLTPGDIAGIGVGVAGLVSDDGSKIVDTPNIPFLPGCALPAALSAIVSSAATFANDCQVALFGEQQAGAAKAARNAIGVFIGTGVGAALIIEGKLFFGSGGVAGNIGRFLVDPLLSLSGSQRHGFIDDMCSRTALASEAAALAVRHYAPYLAAHAGTDLADIRSGDLKDSIDNGDGAVEELVRSRMRMLGIVLANVVNFLNPDLILLGGGVVEAMPDLVRDEIKAAINDHATPPARKSVKVAVAKLRGHAVTTGAAKLALLRAAGGPDTKPSRRSRPRPSAAD